MIKEAGMLINESELSTFLSKVIPILDEELELNSRSKAFDGYELSSADGMEDIRYATIQ